MNVITVEGSFCENNYKDKQDKWRNEYTISCDKLTIESDIWN